MSYYLLISHLARAGTATGSGTRTNKSAVKSSLEWACPQRPDFIFRRHRLPIFGQATLEAATRRNQTRNITDSTFSGFLVVILVANTEREQGARISAELTRLMEKVLAGEMKKSNPRGSFLLCSFSSPSKAAVPRMHDGKRGYWDS